MEPRPSVPPPAPGIVSERLQSGNWLFRWRSYPPLVVMAYVTVLVSWRPLPAGGEETIPLWAGLGLACGVLGLAIRGWTVGHVPLGTSGRGTKELRAETLNTGGIYSQVRHPLYLGNYFMWIGVAVVAGKPTAVLVTTLVFWLYYERIMMAEERFLYERFGETFSAWAAETPPFVPRMGGWRHWPHPFSLRFVLGRDYQAVYGFVAATTAVVLTRSVASGTGWRLSAGWAAYFAAGTLAYLVLHVLKRRTRLLEPAGDR
ncbi:MAG TPA: isoprenylcysteine carboxylmethyltransferase family protein [Longimicrobiales bacterium]|nr:isoprenylcysteine carboxylmethyltransferase family protein [Longimicrobiales bacterium]